MTEQTAWTGTRPGAPGRKTIGDDLRHGPADRCRRSGLPLEELIDAQTYDMGAAPHVYRPVSATASATDRSSVVVTREA